LETDLENTRKENNDKLKSDFEEAIANFNQMFTQQMDKWAEEMKFLHK
jgi:hypothetical protein